VRHKHKTPGALRWKTKDIAMKTSMNNKPEAASGRPRLFRPAAAVPMLVAAMTLAQTVHAITWGEPDNGANPNVGALVRVVDNDPPRPVPGAMGSGSLIHPRVFLTAGHVTKRMEQLIAGGATLNDWRISFGDNAFDSRTWLEIEAVVTHPGFRSPPNSAGGATASGIDVGLIILKEPVQSITPVALAEAGFLDFLNDAGLLRQGRRVSPFTCVGYGTQVQWPPSRIIAADGIRRHADSAYQNLHEHWLVMSQNQALGNGGTGYGDSGGPCPYQKFHPHGVC